MKIKFIIQFYIFCWHSLTSDSTTHWFLNNEGKIQAQIDSIYQLRRPYDFLALIQQEQRAKQVELLKKELMEQKAQIDQNEDKDTQLEERIYRTYTDCILAGRPLTEFDLYASNALDLKVFGINVEEHLGSVPESVDSFQSQTPDCFASMDLPFSMFTLEHLKGMRLRSNLSFLPEENMESLNGESDSNVWGHQLALALQENSSSWLLHTLATQFWRVKGNAQQAMECVRKSIYLASRGTRHIPLFHLGSILHRSRESEDAAIVLHMALDHHKRTAIIHEMLGCVYATVGYYNESVMCLENALHISPKDDNLKKLKHAVLCHSHLEGALEKQLQSLQHTLNELRGYQKKHDEWLNLQQKLLLEQATPEMKLESRLEYEEQKIRESADGRGQDCFQYQQDGHTFLSCNMRRDQLEQQGSSTELLLDLQSLLHTVESETMRLGQQVLKRKPTLPSSVPFVVPLTPSAAAAAARPKSVESSGRRPKEFLASPKQCQMVPPLPQWHAFPTVFLPSENKGVSLGDYLLGLDVLIYDHSTPFVCDSVPALQLEGIDSVPGVRERHSLYSSTVDQFAVDALKRYGIVVDEIESEAKIALAIKQAELPRWAILNLLGLYWRAEGSPGHSMECLRSAIAVTPEKFLDVPLINLASLLYKMGHIDDALAITQRAFAIDPSEIATNFFLANLYLGKGNLTGAWSHYEKVLAIDPEHQYSLKFLTALSCHVNKPNRDKEPNKQSGSTGTENCKTTTSSQDLKETCASDSLQENKNKQIHVKIGGESGAEDGIVDDILPDVLLRVREKAKPPAVPAHLCDKGNKYDDIKHFTSTWLSVSAKNIDLSEFLVGPAKEGTQLQEPICSPELGASMHTLDHLSGIKHRGRLPHYPELGLKEAFQTLTDNTPQPMDLVATRIARSLNKNETSWVLATAAALYWRVMGNGQRAVECLRQSLHYSPRHMKDIPLISLANIFHRSDLLNAALIAANMALEISPNFVVIHFTMANIYAAKGDFEKAIWFYQLTLSLQSTFEPAKDRLRIIQCAVANSENKK